jgi:hypothetical protein
MRNVVFWISMFVLIFFAWAGMTVVALLSLMTFFAYQTGKFSEYAHSALINYSLFIIWPALLTFFFSGIVIRRLKRIQPDLNSETKLALPAPDWWYARRRRKQKAARKGAA